MKFNIEQFSFFTGQKKSASKYGQNEGKFAAKKIYIYDLFSIRMVDLQPGGGGGKKFRCAQRAGRKGRKIRWIWVAKKERLAKMGVIYDNKMYRIKICTKKPNKNVFYEINFKK